MLRPNLAGYASRAIAINIGSDHGHLGCLRSDSDSLQITQRTTNLTYIV
ncbi:hypothetical protein SAMN05444166_5203 [Singulisphaera sp. GP187]|nr:hypothetical protein SAMN05444166_5203 [Singulisphaera sp. GP187]